MTLSATVNRIAYTGNGVTTVFSFPYEFAANEDLVVLDVVTATEVATTKILTTHYTVSGAGSPSGGTVTMLTAPAAGHKLVIYADPAAAQALDLEENGSLPAESTEQALDLIMMVNRRTKDLIGRAVKLPDGFFSSFDPSLPLLPGSNGGNVLALNSTGTGWEWGLAASLIGSSPTFVNTILTGFLATQRRDESSAAVINALGNSKSYVKLTAVVTNINGIAAGVDGQILVLYNNTGSPVTIGNNSGSASVADRIISTNGSDITLNDKSPQGFIYDTAQAKWVVWGGGGAGSSGVDGFQEIPTGVINGINDTFVLSGTPIDQGSTVVYVDGLRSEINEWNLTVTLGVSKVVFTAGNIPVAGQSVQVFYLISVPGSSFVSGFAVQGSGAAPTAVAPAVGLTPTIDALQQKYIKGNAGMGGELVTALPQIANGTQTGQKMVLKMRGNGVDYPIFQDGVGNLVLQGNWPGSPVGILKQSLCVEWDGTSWTEDFRT